MKVKADLHIHTALSPCGSLDMSPQAIVQRACELGLDAIAITDHNSVANGFYAAVAAEKQGLKVFFGMEAQTQEEIHVLSLFEQWSEAESFFRQAYPFLPDVPNNPELFGDQAVVDENNRVVRFEPKLLINSLGLSIGRLIERVRSYGGYVIPAHVESSHFGLLVNLGFIPAELQEHLLEISYSMSEDQVCRLFPELARHPLIANSDSHYLTDLGRAYTVFEVNDLSLAAIYRAGRERKFQVVRCR